MDFCVGRLDHYHSIFDMAYNEMERQFRCALYYFFRERSCRRTTHQGGTHHQCGIRGDLPFDKRYCEQTPQEYSLRITHQDSRIVAKEDSPFFFRNGGFSMMSGQTALRPYHMRLTRSLGRLCAFFKLRKV